MNTKNLISFFYQREGKRMLVLILIGLLLALFDALGILLFLPILHVVGGGSEVDDFVSRILLSAGIPIEIFYILPMLVGIF
ncbi:MAG: hypothetical protein EA358_05095, partial [Flavobacteriales bacterium]